MEDEARNQRLQSIGDRLLGIVERRQHEREQDFRVLQGIMGVMQAASASSAYARPAAASAFELGDDQAWPRYDNNTGARWQQQPNGQWNRYLPPPPPTCASREDPQGACEGKEGA